MALWNDLRIAARSLGRQSPGFTVVAVLTLALGIGATATMFSVVKAVLLRPLDLGHPESLVAVSETLPPMKFGAVSVPDLDDWRRASRSFSALGGYSTWPGFALSAGERTERLPGVRLSASLLSALGASPVTGRLFSPEEDVAGRDGVVVLGEALWRRRFGAAPGIVGSKVIVNGEPRTVVGVLPAWLHFPPDQEAAQVFEPLAPSAAQRSQRGNHWLQVVGRLREGVSLAAAQAEMDGIARGLERQYPDTNALRGALLMPLRSRLVRDVREPLWILFGAVGLLLAIACANVANLLLARAIARWRETAIRTALGASRWALGWRFLLEGLLLALTGAALGLPLAAAALRLLVVLAPRDVPRLAEVALDPGVVLFSIGAALVTGVLFSQAPIWQVDRHEAGELLKAGARASGGPRGSRLRGVLVVSEMALCVCLVYGAGLLARSLWNLARIDPGLRKARVLAADLALPAARYGTPERITALFDRVLARVAALPGVDASGMISLLPGRDWGWNSGLAIEGEAPRPPGVDSWIETRGVSAGYFRAAGIGLAHGRLLAESDRHGAPLVVDINEAAARHFWPPGVDPLGAIVRVGDPDRWRVVGVVRDVHNAGPAKAPLPEVYFPYSQNGSPRMTLVLHTTGDPRTLVPSLRRAVAAEDRELPLDRITTMDEVVAGSIGTQRFQAALLGTFAGLAACLAAFGLYGLLAYTVVQRRQEIGIRLALGASLGEVRSEVLRGALRLALPGIALGLAAAVGLRRLLAGLVFGVSPLDLPTLAAVALGLGAVALLAGLAPANRAARVDPLEALRET
jgi:putative ABC transport system permease protein